MQIYTIENSESTPFSRGQIPPFEPQKIGLPSILGIYGKSLNPLFSANNCYDSEKSLLECAVSETDEEAEKILLSHFQKWARHRAYQEIIDTKAAGSCYRARIPIQVGEEKLERKKVDIWQSKNDRYNFGGLITCGSVWNCPVCAARISERRRLELVEACRVAYFEKQLDIYHLTLTAPHHAQDMLKDLLKSMIRARGLMLNRKPWKRLNDDLSAQGMIKALEVTESEKNGWHVHFHVLMFVSEWLSDRRKKEIEQGIFEQWKSACLTAGLEAPSRKHGVLFESGERAGDYVGKWGAEHEISKSHLKKGREGHLSPFQFLDKYIEGDERYKDLFLEYAAAFKGKRQLVWSDGLRNLLRMEPEKSDEEIAQENDPGSVLFAQLTLDEWRVILQKEKRAEVLWACRNGIENLKNYLDRLTGKAERMVEYE